MKPLSLLLLLIPALCVAGPYWQNVVHYAIDARLNPTAYTITGKERLVYTNNSPDTLREAYFRLYLNAFTKGSRGEKFARQHKSYGWNTTGGISLERFEIVGGDSLPKTPDYTIDNTVMRVNLPRPLSPGDSMVFLFEYTAHVPEGGNRTGHRGRDFNIAQWYPQISVYDRYGWDKNQYLTPAEFHNEFGTFDVSITLPRSFVLGYSGRILNPEEVYPDSVRSRLERTRDVDTTVNILDYSGMEWTPADTAVKTWKFRADEASDFAWSANEHYIWDAECWHPGGGAEPITIHALYVADKREYWRLTAHYGRHAISFFSTHYGLFAFPNMFVVEGTEGGGMEYPGLTFLGHFGDPTGHTLHDVAAHEIGHNWYPMMLGSNETYYAFMDEGFNTFITATCIEDFYGRYHQEDFTAPIQKILRFDPEDERQNIQGSALDLEKSGYEEPIATHVYRFSNQGLAVSSIYDKTAAVMFMLQYVMGDSVFGHAMQEYYNRFKFRHVYPEDFYQTMQEAGGQKDLRWFFNEWFERALRCDYGVSGLRYERHIAAGTTVYAAHVSVHRYEQAIMPIDVRFTMENGSQQTVWFPIDKWLNGETKNDTTVDLPSPPVRADLNPDGRILDVNRLNNTTGLPPVKFGLDNSLWYVTPVDSYQVLWRPSLWYTDEGGWKIGAKLTGSYLDDFYKFTLGFWYNVREGKPDYDLGLSQNTTFLSSLSGISGRIYHLEGRTGAAATLRKSVRENYSVPPFHTFTFTYNYLDATNTEYLLSPATWENGVLQRIIASYDYYNRGEWWSGGASVGFESSVDAAGRSDFSYSKRVVELKANLSFIPDINLAFRAFDGSGTGTLPAQVKYYFADASPADMMNAPFFRSKGPLPSTIRDHAEFHGGGDMRGYIGPYAGDRVEAINAEARFNTLFPFVDAPIPGLSWFERNIRSVLFLDAGRIASDGMRLWDERLEADLGFGFRLGPITQFLGPFARTNLLSGVGLTTIRVDFPIYDTKAPDGENKLKLRWVAGINEIF